VLNGSIGKGWNLGSFVLRYWGKCCCPVSRIALYGVGSAFVIPLKSDEIVVPNRLDISPKSVAVFKSILAVAIDLNFPGVS